MAIKKILHQLNFGSVHEIIVVFVVVAMPFTPCADVINYDFGLLEQREYVRTNTWNGCVRYEGLGDNIFRNWKCSPNERLSAVHAARHFIKYSMAEEVPLSYYEEDVFDDHERDGLKTNTNEVLRCYRMNFNQFEPPAHGKYGVGGLEIHDMQARILPFVVCNSNSKSALHCILVAFFRDGRFFMATYFNANTGKVVLDFHDISQSGGMLLASESRYPYLTPDECAIQDKIISSLPLQNPTARVSNQNGIMVTNTCHESDEAYLEIRSNCPVIRHPWLNGGTLLSGEFLGFSFGSSKNINASNFETNGDSLVVFKSLENPYMEWFDRVSLWHNQDHRLYRIDVQGQMPEDFSARQRYGFYNALTNDLGKGFGVSLTRLPYRPDMPYDATGTVSHLQFHVNIGRKNCRMSIVSHAPSKKSERGSVTLSDGMIKINAEDL